MARTSEALRTLRIGVDSGGTFTDICFYDSAVGPVQVWKVGMTPHDPSIGIAEGIVQGLQAIALGPGETVEIGYFGCVPRLPPTH